jgi:fructuronate reductase
MMRLEIIPTLAMPAAQLDSYCTALLKRFANPGLQHLTQQIAMDGSQKIPQRLLTTIRDTQRLGLSCERLLLGVACWVRYVAGVDENKQPVTLVDPLQPWFAEAASQLPDSDRFCDAILDLQQVFGTDLSQAQWFRDALKQKVSSLFSEGVVATLKQHCKGEDQ